MNNLSNKVNQNAKEKYRTYNSVNPRLSSSSVSYMSIKNKNTMIGGNQKRCIEALNSFNSKKIELALYIINTFDCDWSCQDQNGNTILHHIVLCSKTNQECLSTIKLVLSNANIKSFIDKQNNEGQTAMLLAVINGMDKIAYELEKAGANKTIEDNYGNLIQTDKEIEDSNDDSNDEVNYDNSDYATPNEHMLTNNLLKLIVPSETNNNLSSLNLSESMPVENNDFRKINFSDNSSDQFINMVKNNLQDLMNKQDNVEMDNNMLDNEPSSTTEDFIQVLSNKYKNNKNLYNNNSRDLLHKKVKNDSHPININNYNLIIDSDKINSFAPKSSKKMLDSKMNDDSDATSSFVPTNHHNKLLDSKTSDDTDVINTFLPTKHHNKLFNSKNNNDDVTSSFVPTNHNNLLDSKTSDDTDVTSSFMPTNNYNKLLDSKTSDNSDATSSFAPTNNFNNKTLDSNTSDDLNQFTKSLKKKMNSTKKSSSFEKKINTKKSFQNDDSDIDTDDLMEVIGNVQKDMTGGTINSNKIMGYRKLKLHSDIEGELDEENIDDLENESDLDEEDEEELEETETETETENTNEEKSKPKSKSKVYIDESDNNDDNELSRLINSRKNEIHNEVINTIMGMLNQGEILYKNKPIKSSERNAKLIKSYLYKKVSEKNPQLTGMDKILIIQKMSKTELLTSLKEMPDLDELEKTIEKHMQTKKEQYDSENDNKSKKKETKNNDKKETKNDEKKVKSTKETKSKKSKKEIIETESD
jgi:hypothetical protein